MISIVIPTKDRNNFVPQLLSDIKGECGKEVEVIVVDDGSKQLVDTKEFRNVLHVQCLRSEATMGPALARNKGVEHAKGNWLVFLDDDIRLPRGWFDNLQNILESHASLDIMWGAVVYQTRDAHYPMRIVQNPRAKWPMGAFMIVKKTSFSTLGGFDPVFAEYHNEDTELAIRAHARGMRLSSLSQIKVIHRESHFSGVILLESAKNAAVWPLLRHRYPKTWNIFKISHLGPLLYPEEYLYLLFYPILLFPLLLRYLFNNRHNPDGTVGMFFLKWPVWFIARRLWIWYISYMLLIKNKNIWRVPSG